MPKATQLITCGARTSTACPGSQTNTLWLPHIAIPDCSSSRRDAFSQNKGSEATHHPPQHRFGLKKKKKKSLRRKGDMKAGNVADAPFPLLWKSGANKSFSFSPPPPSPLPGGRGQDGALPALSGTCGSGYAMLELQINYPTIKSLLLVPKFRVTPNHPRNNSQVLDL